MSPERRRLTYALLLSLLIHAWLLSLTFGGQGLWLPGFGFPRQDDLPVVVVPAQVATEPTGTSGKQTLQGSIGQPVSGGPAVTPSVSPAPTLGRTAEAIVPKPKRTARAKPTPAAPPTAEAKPAAEAAPTAETKPAAEAKSAAEATPTAEARPEPDAATGASSANAPLRAEGAGDAAPAPTPGQAVIAVERSDEATFVMPAAPSGPAPVIAAAPSTSGPETVMLAPKDAGDVAQEAIDPTARERADALAKRDRSEREAKRQAVQPEAATIETARQEAERQEAARQQAARQEAARAEAARAEAARAEAARAEAARAEAARAEAARAEAARAEAVRQAADLQAAQQVTAQQEAARVEAARVEAARAEAARVEAARAEAARAEVARAEAARAEAARAEAARAEAARAEAARAEAARAEAARTEAARAEAARAEAARAEAARAEAARTEAARAEAARAEAARAEAARYEAVREERLKAIGRQLDEERAQRDAAAAARESPSLPAWRTARRYRLFGRTDPNEEIIRYAEAWSRKIELNTPVETVREMAKQPRTDPLVTVAIRSDGSVESVTIVQSSGVAAIDEAIRRIVDSQKPYPVFPPGLAREWDVIEIRRTWYFDTAIRLN